jgi:AraC-like DNA-binding protein
MADVVMYEASLRELEALSRRLDSGDSLVTRVEQLIATSRDRIPTLEEAAKHTHVSSRTLIRRLAQLGTTYHELIDTHRRERAEAMLKNPDFALSEISHRLGYGDTANFGRACRRWFGMAPGGYRRRLLASSASSGPR